MSSFAYNGISFEDDGITDDIFINFAIVGAVQIPSILIAYLAITKLGRRIPLSITFMAATIACLALIPLNESKFERTVFFIKNGVEIYTINEPKSLSFKRITEFKGKLTPQNNYIFIKK